MASSRHFVDFVLDQLGGSESLRAKSMFGGFGIYDDELFFAIVADDELYFKVDDTNRPDFEAAGSEPFTFESAKTGRSATMSYWRVPVRVLENRAELAAWAGRSCDVARRAPKKRK